MSSAQQCDVCDALITGEPFHSFEKGKVYRFCTTQHRHDFNELRQKLEANDAS